jgi:phage baseplate assembly protein W
MSHFGFPYAIDGTGRTASASPDTHLRHLIEQVLFTSPGERVNRPDFGCGLLRLVFGPNRDVLAATAQSTVQGALQRWLGELLTVQAVEVAAEDSVLRIVVRYLPRQSQVPVVDQFVLEGP